MIQITYIAWRIDGTAFVAQINGTDIFGYGRDNGPGKGSWCQFIYSRETAINKL